MERNKHFPERKNLHDYIDTQSSKTRNITSHSLRCAHSDLIKEKVHCGQRRNQTNTASAR